MPTCGAKLFDMPELPDHLMVTTQFAAPHRKSWSQHLGDIRAQRRPMTALRCALIGRPYSHGPAITHWRHHIDGEARWRPPPPHPHPLAVRMSPLGGRVLPQRWHVCVPQPAAQGGGSKIERLSSAAMREGALGLPQPSLPIHTSSEGSNQGLPHHGESM